MAEGILQKTPRSQKENICESLHHKGHQCKPLTNQEVLYRLPGMAGSMGIGILPKPYMERRRMWVLRCERAFQMVSGKKGEKTRLLRYISTGGLCMPPMVIFKSSKIKWEWIEVASSRYFIRGSQTGYINAKLFYKYGEQFVKFSKEKNILTGGKKMILLLDMHKSNLFNIDFMEYMKANNIKICSFPPHCTHLLQPLDDTP